MELCIYLDGSFGKPKRRVLVFVAVSLSFFLSARIFPVSFLSFLFFLCSIVWQPAGLNMRGHRQDAYCIFSLDLYCVVDQFHNLSTRIIRGKCGKKAIATKASIPFSCVHEYPGNLS